jgi:hypothetical protein
MLLIEVVVWVVIIQLLDVVSVCLIKSSCGSEISCGINVELVLLT